MTTMDLVLAVQGIRAELQRIDEVLRRMWSVIEAQAEQHEPAAKAEVVGPAHPSGCYPAWSIVYEFFEHFEEMSSCYKPARANWALRAMQLRRDEVVSRDDVWTRLRELQWPWVMHRRGSAAEAEYLRWLRKYCYVCKDGWRGRDWLDKPGAPAQTLPPRPAYRYRCQLSGARR